MLAVGEEVGKFEIEAELGSGGMARVYRVRHRTLRVAYALKVLTRDSSNVRERMKKEGRIQAALSHPNVVRVVDSFELRGLTALVLDLVRGAPLDSLLEVHRFSDREILATLGGVLAGIHAAHEIGLAHRDLKPENILMHAGDSGLVPKVADFGLAKGEIGSVRGKPTRAGQIMGSPGYMAPEQITDASRSGTAADMWALGALIYEMTTGTPAFGDEMELSDMKRVVNAEYVDPSVHRPDLPAPFAEAIRRCLDVDPQQRPGPCELAGILAQKPTPASIAEVLPTVVSADSPVAGVARGMAYRTPTPPSRVTTGAMGEPPTGGLDGTPESDAEGVASLPGGNGPSGSRGGTGAQARLVATGAGLGAFGFAAAGVAAVVIVVVAWLVWW